MAVDRQTKLDRLYELTGACPGMPIEEALQRAEGEWSDEPASLSDTELQTSHDILISILDNMASAKENIETVEAAFRRVLISRGFRPARPSQDYYRR
jgi:flagellar motor switch protein FliM